MTGVDARQVRYFTCEFGLCALPIADGEGLLTRQLASRELRRFVRPHAPGRGHCGSGLRGSTTTLAVRGG